MNAEVVVYYNDSYVTTGVIYNASEVGEYSPCVFLPEQANFRPGNCIPGTERALLGNFYLAPGFSWIQVSPISFFYDPRAYFYNGTHFTYLGNYSEVFQTATSDFWLGTKRDGIAYYQYSHSDNCLGWKETFATGYLGQETYTTCAMKKKYYCGCLVEEGTIPGTTRTPSLNPTPPSLSPSMNPSVMPSESPSNHPTAPTPLPTDSPSNNPTKAPTSGGGGANKHTIVALTFLFIIWCL